MLSGWVSGLQKLIPVFALVSSVFLIGCAANESAPFSPSNLPVDSARLTFQVREYGLVEASTDNPNHLEFQQRAQAAVIDKRTAWLFSDADAVQETNRALAPFGYYIAANPSPPFSGFALYHDNQMVQRDIARFWPVSVTASESWEDLDDFVLSFETLNGEKMVASSAGIRPWPGQEQSARGLQKPLYPDQVAFADNTGSELGVITGQQPLYAGKLAADIFGLQMIAEKPFYFYVSGDLVHLNYAGKDLAYVYDRVEHNNTGEIAIFNPGGTGQVSWFYALRDGLWYYVEVGMFE